MALVTTLDKPNLAFFKKCGEITTAMDVGKKIFALNCIFCTTVCLHFEAFALHVEENHHRKVYMDNTTENEVVPCEGQTEVQYDMPKDEKFENMVLESKKEECPSFDDPLLEAPMSVISTEFSSVHVKDENFFEKTKEHPDEEINQGFDDPADEDINSEDNSSIETDNNNDDIADNDENFIDFDESNIDSKKLLLTLIEGYQKYDVLWNTKCSSSKNIKKREYALESIALTIDSELNMSISTKTISKRLRSIRSKYFAEIKRQKKLEPFDETYEKPWYFDRLTFLNKKTTYKPRNKRGTKALANEKPALPLPNLTEAQNIGLIEIYKSFPCLWDMEHIGFRFKAQRNEALDQMNKAIENKLNLNLTQDELQKKLYRIRYACTQEKHRKLQCERMQKVFKPSTAYSERISFLVDNVGPFKCDFCEETFNGADQYRIHKSKHDGSMPFVCPICNRGFMKVGNCTVHVRRHTRDYPFECQECGKRFATTTDVNVHKRYHTGEKPYFCEICGQSFRTWSFFDAHMRRHQKRPSHKCTICSKAFYENNKLTEHMKAHLNVRDKICNICDKAFTSSKYLRQHKQIHSEKKKYVCKICDKGFAQYAGLSGHMKSHGTTVSGSSVVEENKKKKIKNEIFDN